MNGICDHYQSFATVSGAAVARACELRSLRATNGNAAVRYLQLFDDVDGPSAAQAATYSFLLPAGTGTGAVPYVLELDENWFADRVPFTTGLSWGFSTTATTYTAATAGDHSIALRTRG